MTTLPHPQAVPILDEKGVQVLHGTPPALAWKFPAEMVWEVFYFSESHKVSQHYRDEVRATEVLAMMKAKMLPGAAMTKVARPEGAPVS